MHCITEINFCHFNLEFHLPAWSLTSPTWESLPLRNPRSWWILHTQTLDLDTLHFCFSSEREMDSVSLVGEKEITYFILIENLIQVQVLDILTHEMDPVTLARVVYLWLQHSVQHRVLVLLHHVVQIHESSHHKKELDRHGSQQWCFGWRLHYLPQ